MFRFSPLVPSFFFGKWGIVTVLVSGAVLFLLSWLTGDEKGKSPGCFGLALKILLMLWVGVLIVWASVLWSGR